MMTWLRRIIVALPLAVIAMLFLAVIAGALFFLVMFD